MLRAYKMLGDPGSTYHKQDLKRVLCGKTDCGDEDPAGFKTENLEGSPRIENANDGGEIRGMKIPEGLQSVASLRWERRVSRETIDFANAVWPLAAHYNAFPRLAPESWDQR